MNNALGDRCLVALWGTLLIGGYLRRRIFPCSLFFCFFLMGPIFSMRRRIEIGHLTRFKTIVIAILHGPWGGR